jgi:hypothetical protein
MKGERKRTISHFINGRSVTCDGVVTTPAYDPNTGEVQAGVGTITRPSWRGSQSGAPPGLRLTRSGGPGRYSSTRH